MKKVLHLTDLHMPFEDRRTMKAVLKYIGDNEWDKIILAGDVMDFNCISSHNINNLRAVEGTSLQKDYDYANAQLDKLMIEAGDAKIVYLEGNHEYRVTRYINANPRLAGSIEVPKCLNLAPRGIQWVPSWSKGVVYRMGKAGFIHGLYVNDHHAKQTVSKYGENIFYGHTHDVQQYSLTRNGDNKTIVGHSLGCLCNYKQFYTQGRPNRWQQAITEFKFFDDGLFTYHVIPIFKHRFSSPEGKTYQG